MSSSGLVIHTSYPHMGASPDGSVNCDRCGRGVLEIKCPFSCKDRSFLGVTAESKFFLKDDLILKQDHSHYFQIQLQLRVCDTSYGDFIVWRQDEMVMEHILVDNKFLDASLEKATHFLSMEFFQKYLGSGIPGYPITYRHLQKMKQHLHKEEMWCFCHTPESGEMIACDNEQCNII